jgi:hypothetical protein
MRHEQGTWPPTCCTWSSCWRVGLRAGGGGGISAERLGFDRSDQQKWNPLQSHAPIQLFNTPPRHICSVLKANIGPFATYSTCTCCFFGTPALFPVLYPLGKSVGYETSGVSCPSPHNTRSVGSFEAVRPDKKTKRCGLREPSTTLATACCMEVPSGVSPF